MSRFQVVAAAPKTHDTVLRIVETQFGPLQGRSVLDAPCGAGRVSKALAEMGADVTGIDIEAHPEFVFDEKRRILADLNLALPFERSTFDLVLSIEGIEHLENPTFFVREIARVLRPNGIAVITTPNVDSFRSRLSRLVRGHYKFFRPVSAHAREYGHIHPIDMVFLRGAAAKAGLTVACIEVNEVTDGHRALKERLRPWLTRHWPEEMRGRLPFYGDVIIYVLRREGAGAADSTQASTDHPENRQAPVR